MIALENISHEFHLQGGTVTALRDVTLRIEAGAFVAVMGPSGSGKTTLIQLIGGLLTPSRGDVVVDGQSLRRLDDAGMSAFRNRTIGFVFQFFNLPAYYTALENVALPLVFAGVDETTRLNRARSLLEEFGLVDRLRHRPDELSGGEAQRVAIARALIANPRVILADEPTGNLDRENGRHVLALLQQINRDRGVTVVMVSHDEQDAACAGSVVRIEKGAIITTP
jgi:putative ABC transport system ATP-binding protein